MQGELRELVSLDAPDGLDQWQPDDASSFGILIDATVGPAVSAVGWPGSEGGDLFRVKVVGPEFFASDPPGKGYRWGHGYLVVDRWDFEMVKRVIADVCRRAEGDDWDAVARKLGRIMSWEFEEYDDWEPQPG